jgi:DNA-binding transcriptional MerR regulator
MDARYTIDELGARATAALATGYEPPKSGQINPLPARRSIRYYTTLGILDRPAEMRGRTAYYGARHLRQLVAIKRLQAEGLSLAQIQARLAGIPDAELEALARVPSEVLDGGSAPLAAAAPRRPPAFWLQVPDGAGAGPSAEAAAEPQAERPSPDPDMLIGLPLEPGIWLQLEPARPLTADDARALRRAAEPLIAALRARGLIQSASPPSRGRAPVADKEDEE